MTSARLRAAIVLGSLAWWSCNGRLEFDVPGNASGTGGSAGWSGGSGPGGSDPGGSGPGGSGPGGSGAAAGAGGASTAGQPSSNVCEQCAAQGMHCQASTPECVECLVDDDCRDEANEVSGNAFCDPQLYRCVPCSPSSTQGGGCERGRVCFGWSHSCVRSCATEFDPDHDCGMRMTCDLTSYVCLACASDADCQGSAAGSHCVAGGARCGACLSDGDCEGDRPHCDPLTFECVGCRDMRDCPAGTICLMETQTCSG